jgi:hypothetical protein
MSVTFDIPSSATARQDLPEILNMYGDNFANFAWGKAFPILPVQALTGRFTKMDLANFVERVNTKRGRGAKYARSATGAGGDTWALQEYAFKKMVDQLDGLTIGNPEGAKQAAALMSLLNVHRDIENDAVGVVQNDTTFPIDNVSGHTAAATWDNASGKPLDDRDKAFAAQENRSPTAPNSCIIHRKAVRALSRNAQIRDSFKGASDDRVLLRQLNEDGGGVLNEILGVPNVIVVATAQNTAKRGQTASLSQLWSTVYVTYCVLSKAPTLDVPQSFRTMFYSPELMPVDGASMSVTDLVAAMLQCWELEETDPVGSSVTTRGLLQLKTINTECTYNVKGVL